MAHSAFTVGWKHRFLTARFKLMAKFAVHSSANNLSHFSLHTQVKLMRKVEQHCIILVVVWETPQVGQLALRYSNVTNCAEFSFRCLRGKPLLVTSVASFMSGPIQGCTGLAFRLVTVSTLSSRFQ